MADPLTSGSAKAAANINLRISLLSLTLLPEGLNCRDGLSSPEGYLDPFRPRISHECDPLSRRSQASTTFVQCQWLGLSRIRVPARATTFTIGRRVERSRNIAWSFQRTL